ncbi:hypothetical protein [Pseudomonas sp. Marseille-QA0892]
MIEESRRRAYLEAMQVTTWLPRCELPFAAPSRPELLQFVEVECPQAEPLAPERHQQAESQPQKTDAPMAVRPAGAPVQSIVERLKQDIKRGAASPPAPIASPVEQREPSKPTPVESLPPPRFSLQLARAGACLLMVELPTGEPFQSRDPAYLLLRDILRAAGLPDSPQWIGEPVRWPQFTGRNFDQGPDAARDYVQGFVAGRMEAGDRCQCLWLVGLPAVRFAGNGDESSYDQTLQIEGIGSAWALPGLEVLMEDPKRKASLWKAMKQVRQCWLERHE